MSSQRGCPLTRLRRERCTWLRGVLRNENPRTTDDRPRTAVQRGKGVSIVDQLMSFLLCSGTILWLKELLPLGVDALTMITSDRELAEVAGSADLDVFDPTREPLPAP